MAKRPQYGAQYQRDRKRLLAGWFPCLLRLPGCLGRATSLDHRPAIALHRHVEGSGCCRTVDACIRCNQRSGGWRTANIRRGYRVKPLPTGRTPPPSRRW